MIFGLLVATTTCIAVWLLTGSAQQRAVGAVFGLIDSILWLLAGVSAGKLIIVAIAAFCALCFARPFLRSYRYARIRRHYVK
ncbi:hypothetical protein [Paraburkholderia terricola]|uniref:hypothetical protein n=1 Tax=Paraburkholderia terricola TaxID=169427 RepID=UPI0009F61607|nr:hypothetical protein [Paraburkholderia terricola]AXE92886.1 hypothetical protein CUJ90_11475 [Paraburkholderia terricola]ORC49940.1 hypothetical protein B2G74_18755 [Burkholderia sp. A27]